MDPLMVVLRVAHIGAGVMWVGAAWMMYLFVQPSLQTLGPDAQREFMGNLLRRRRLAHTILVATVVTVGAGAAMLAIDISRYGVQFWFGSSFGIGITLGAVAGISSFIIGPVLIVPLTNRLEKMSEEIGPGSEPTPEQTEEFGRVGLRLRRVLMWDSALLAAAVVLMAISRYL